MNKLIYLLIIPIFFFLCCSPTVKTEVELKMNAENSPDTLSNKIAENKLDTLGSTIEARFKCPENFERTKVGDLSFESYLRNLPLKPHGSSVKKFNGAIKINYNVYDAVIDLPIGNKDLHQCADAIMRLKAEYLWNQKRYSEIHFNFVSGLRADYSKWMEGKRIVYAGNNTHWTDSGTASNTYKDFWNYMECVFRYASTLSLTNELKSVPIESMQIGDVFIHGGAPGHAIIVVDMAINPETKEKLFLLAQSYMPAQEIQLLKNPNNEGLSPWYSLSFSGDLFTPEWTFSQDELKRFVD